MSESTAEGLPEKPKSESQKPNAPNKSIFCVLGDNQTFKTTLLLHYSYLFLRLLKNGQLTQDKLYTVFICHKQKIYNQQMLFGQYSQCKQQLLQNIKVKYLENYPDLIKYLCSFHVLEIKPQFVCLDDLDSFIGVDQDKVQKKMFILHLLNNISATLADNSFINNIHMFKVGFSSQFILSSSDKNPQKLQANCDEMKIYLNYFVEIFFIEKARPSLPPPQQPCLSPQQPLQQQPLQVGQLHSDAEPQPTATATLSKLKFVSDEQESVQKIQYKGGIMNQMIIDQINKFFAERSLQQLQ